MFERAMYHLGKESELVPHRELLMSRGIPDAYCMIQESSPKGNIEENNHIGSTRDVWL